MSECRKARYRTSEKGRAENRERMARRRAKLAGAAVKLRRLIDAEGSAACGLCGDERRASELDVDHRIPLEAGGADSDDNVWPLCRRPCHFEKSRSERTIHADASLTSPRLVGVG